jgi:hypothetical protein
MSDRPDWPHDKDGNPMQIISWEQSESIPVPEGSKNPAWLSWGHTIRRPVPMGAGDEIDADRAALRAEVEKIIDEVSSVLWEKRNAALKELQAPVEADKKK